MKERGWQYTAATVLLAAIVTFGWCWADLLKKVETAEITWNPPTQGELWMCVVYTALAVGVALKLDIPLLGSFIKGDLKSLVGGKPSGE